MLKGADCTEKTKKELEHSTPPPPISRPIAARSGNGGRGSGVCSSQVPLKIKKCHHPHSYLALAFAWAQFLWDEVITLHSHLVLAKPGPSALWSA